MSSPKKIRQEWPTGTRVEAEYPDGSSEFLPGFISAYTEAGMVVRFDEGGNAEYPYGYIDLKHPRNSVVVATEY